MCWFSRKMGVGEAKKDPDKGVVCASSGKAGPTSLHWALVSVPLARASGSRRILLQTSWSLLPTFSSLPRATIVSGDSPTTGQTE